MFSVQYRLLVDAVHLVYEELTTFGVQYRLLVDAVHLVWVPDVSFPNYSFRVQQLKT